MANTKSAIKRIKINERNRLRNKAYKSSVKTLMKKCIMAANEQTRHPSPEAAALTQERLSEAYSRIDKAVKRGVLHPNNGARKKARLARIAKQAAQAAAPTAE